MGLPPPLGLVVRPQDMNVFPRTGTGWMRVILLPVQVYVAAAWMVLKIYVEAAGGHRDYGFHDLIIFGYAFSIVALCTGAWLQRRSGDRKGSGLSILIAIIAVILLPMCFPVL